MKVHHIIHNIGLRDGGAQRLARHLHNGLRAREVDSRLVVLMATFRDHSESSCSLNLSRPYSLRAIPKLISYIKNHCGKHDLIHTHLFPSMLFTSIAVRLADWKGVLIGTEHSTNNRRRNTLFGRFIDALMYSRYDLIVCISKGARSSLAGWKPSLSSRLEIVENGAPLPFTSFEERQPTDRPIVVSVGRLNGMKNYDSAIRAVSLLDGLDFEYCIAGPGPREAELIELSRRLGVDGKVRLLGFVDDVPALLREADIFLMPSRWEGFGIAAVEAMNAGLPVVVSAVDGLSDVVEASPPCGVFVQPDDPKSIARGLRDLLVNRRKRLDFGRHGFHHAKQFSVDSMVDKYLALYRRLEWKTTHAETRKR